MEDGHEPALILLEPLAAKFGDAGLAKKGFAGDVAGEEDDLGVDEADDVEEVGFVGGDFQGGGFAEGFAVFARWKAEDGVGDEEVFVGVPAACFENLVEEFSGAPDEGFAFDVFFGAGGFADEHEFGLGVAAADDDVGARVGEGVVGHGVHFLEEFIEGGRGAGDFAEEVELHGGFLF